MYLDGRLRSLGGTWIVEQVSIVLYAMNRIVEQMRIASLMCTFHAERKHAEIEEHFKRVQRLTLQI